MIAQFTIGGLSYFWGMSVLHASLRWGELSTVLHVSHGQLNAWIAWAGRFIWAV